MDSVITIGTANCNDWKNKKGTKDRDCACGSWKAHWENFSKKKWTEKCSVKKCDNEATLGAHIINTNISGEWIVPFCDSCNKTSEEFSLKLGTALVSANKKLTCENTK